MRATMAKRRLVIRISCLRGEGKARRQPVSQSSHQGGEDGAKRTSHQGGEHQVRRSRCQVGEGEATR